MLIARRFLVNFLQQMLKAVLQKYTRQNLGCTLKIGNYKIINNKGKKYFSLV